MRLVKNTLGVYRLDHDSGAHDDQAVALALAVHHLLDAEPGRSFPIFDDVDTREYSLTGAPDGHRAVGLNRKVVAFVDIADGRPDL